jgi:hypothetical protein
MPSSRGEPCQRHLETDQLASDRPTSVRYLQTDRTAARLVAVADRGPGSNEFSSAATGRPRGAITPEA